MRGGKDMKKTIPVIAPISTGLLGGWYVECFLCLLSIMVSPFARPEETQYFIFFGISSLLSALLILVMVIVDAMFLIDLDDKKKIRFYLIAQICVVILLFFVSWICAERIVHHYS